VDYTPARDRSEHKSRKNYEFTWSWRNMSQEIANFEQRVDKILQTSGSRGGEK
jgi:hypothetical protein